MKKKGFTLIELLAVIVILAIIALIATPVVINIINDAQISADKRSIELYLDTVNKTIVNKNLTEDFNPEDCTISNYKLTCDGQELDIAMDGSIPSEGTIIIENDKIKIYKLYINGRYYSNETKESCFETTNVNIDDISGLEITKYNCKNDVSNLIIPDTIYGKAVISIGISAFNSSNLTSVIIPNSVNTIKGGAFSNNKLTTITIPDSVTFIGSSAFNNNKLTTITIPDSVTLIGSSAFNNNQLQEDQAFIYKREKDGSIDNLTIISYGGQKKDLIIPNGVKSIYGLDSIGLTSITIPSSVTTIDYRAFSNNKLASVTIPSSVTSIGNSAFSNNKLTSVTIPSSVTSIGDSVFSNNSLTSITIPSSVKSIGANAFSNNKLTSITISDGVTSIGESAFSNNGLTSITIPSSVTSIGGYAFSNNSLTSVTILGKESLEEFESFGPSSFGTNFATYSTSEATNGTITFIP